MPPPLPGRCAARVDQEIDPYKSPPHRKGGHCAVRTAAAICGRLVETHCTVGRHALMPPPLPGRCAARVDQEIDPYKSPPHRRGGNWPSAAVEIAGAYAGAYAMRPYIETGGAVF